MKDLTLLSSRASRLAFAIIISLLLTMTSGCGKKGPVKPKTATISSAVEELSLVQRGNFFVLGWTRPEKNLDGGKTEDLAGFRVKRLTYVAADGCPTCREPDLEVADIDIKHPDPAQLVGNRVYWRDFDIRPGNGYRYAVTPVTTGDVEGPVTTIHQAVLQPPPAPTNLEVEAGDRQVKLQWQMPDLPENMALLGYNLYRRQAKRSFSIVPVNGKPLQSNQLLDRGLDNGRAYEYRVSALVQTDGKSLESMASPAALITPQEGR